MKPSLIKNKAKVGSKRRVQRVASRLIFSKYGFGGLVAQSLQP